MAVLLSTVEVNAMSLKNALQSKELSLDFDRGGTIWCGYTNTDNKVPVNKKDYLFDKNTFFIDMSTLHISTNTVKLGSNNIPFNKMTGKSVFIILRLLEIGYIIVQKKLKVYII